MEPLTLRPLNADDEARFLQVHTATADYEFGLHYEAGMAWVDYVTLLADFSRGLNLLEGYVPATFLIAEVGGEIVGRSSIRHDLNDFLAEHGGHIGYVVTPDHRRRGYATEILRQSLTIARSLGVAKSLLIVDDDNVGSIRAIEQCGGELETVKDLGDGPYRKYWIS